MNINQTSTKNIVIPLNTPPRKKSFNAKILSFKNDCLKDSFTLTGTQNSFENLKKSVTGSLSYDWQYNQKSNVRETLKIEKWYDYPQNKDKLNNGDITEKGLEPPFIKNPKSKIDIKIPVHRIIKPKIDNNAGLNFDKETVQSLDKEINTHIKRNYGSRINWSREKIARDVMQNFYDGHSQILDGVKIEINPSKTEGFYKIKISGDGEYKYSEVLDLGSGTKEEDKYNAGGYGEGSKIFTIQLLAKFAVPSVIFSSKDWKMTYKLGNSNGENEDYLYRKLERQDNKKGNYLEFETNDTALLNTILKSTNYFYHSQNPDFKNSTFENEHFGIKYLGKNKKGNIYLANQRFEFNKPEQWDNELDNLTIFFKRKSNLKDFDHGRDRMKLEVREIAKLIKNDFGKTMSDDELIKLIYNLEEIWDSNYFNNEGIILNAFLELAEERKLGVKVPEEKKILSDKGIIPWDEREKLKKEGYRLCASKFSALGIKTVVEKLNEQYNFKSLKPTNLETQRIKILDKATEIIADYIKSKDNPEKIAVILKEDAQKPTYIYNRRTNEGTDDTLGRAIIEKQDYNDRIYNGHWVDRAHLNEDSFSALLSTRLHEICHKYGDDGNKSFSYALTHVITSLNEIMLTNSKIRKELEYLNQLWNIEIPNQDL